MKRVIGAATVIVVLVAVAGCGGGAAVSENEAKAAFLYSYGSIFMASFALAFGEEVEGASLEQETEDLVFDEFDFAGFGETVNQDTVDSIEYTSISGRVSQTGESLVADVTLEGGPVEALEFEVSNEVFQTEGSITVTVTANGNEMELTIEPADMQ